MQLADITEPTQWSEAINKAALENIHSGKFDVTGDIEPNLFDATLGVLNNAVDMAFGEVDPIHPDFEFVNQLKYNNGVFAAFKTHRQQNELAALLVDAEGKAVSFGAFEKAARPTLLGYNRNWLQTEYNTAITRARFAANVKSFGRDAHIYPNMEWIPSRSPDPRREHEIFYGTVLPINHPFWSKHHPGDLYNCKCGIQQTTAKATPEPRATDPITRGLDESPVTAEALFTKSHPMIIGASKQTTNTVNGFVNSKLQKYFKGELATLRNTLPVHNPVEIVADNFATGKMNFKRLSIRGIDQHAADWRVKAHALNMQNSKQWKYIGHATDTAHHIEAEYFFYYKVMIGKKERFVNVIFNKDLKAEIVYCIMDTIDLKKVKKGLPKALRK